MQVSLTEDDLRSIWQDIYVRTFTASKHVAEGAHKDAAGEADAAIALLRADGNAQAKAESCEAVRRLNSGDIMPVILESRTAEDERRDVLAFMTAEWEALGTVVSEVEDDDIATRRDARRAELRYLIRVFTSGGHVGAADRTEVKP